MPQCKPALGDIAFFVFLAGLLVAVALLGQMNFREGLKTEATKMQAEILIAWMKASAGHRQTNPDFSPRGCAYKVADTLQPSTWGTCTLALFDEQGPLKSARNSFSGEMLQFVERCNPGDASTVGQFAVARVVSTPPGSAVPVVVSPLSSEERIDQRLSVRVTVCDKGGYAIWVGDADF